MTRSTRWPLAVAALLPLGCVGPFADVVDEAVQDTPADYDECCAGDLRTGRAVRIPARA